MMPRRPPTLAARVGLLRRAHQGWTTRCMTAEPPRGARLPPRWFDPRRLAGSPWPCTGSPAGRFGLRERDTRPLGHAATEGRRASLGRKPRSVHPSAISRTVPNPGHDGDERLGQAPVVAQPEGLNQTPLSTLADRVALRPRACGEQGRTATPVGQVGQVRQRSSMRTLRCVHVRPKSSSSSPDHERRRPAGRLSSRA